MSFEELLLQAVATGELDKIKEALAAGVNIDAKDDRGDTALWLAIKKAQKNSGTIPKKNSLEELDNMIDQLEQLQYCAKYT